MHAWAEELFRVSLDLAQPQLLGLAFLLGSFAVATLSDIKRLSAQREFLEVWVLFTLGVLAYDGFVLWQGDWHAWQVPAAKWGLVGLLSVLSWQRVGVLFRLARADVFACAAAASLLSPVLVLGFWVVLFAVAAALKPLLSRGTGPWPFMPVVTVSAVLVMVAGLVAPGGEWALLALP